MAAAAAACSFQASSFAPQSRVPRYGPFDPRTAFLVEKARNRNLFEISKSEFELKWKHAQDKKELQQERDNVRFLTYELEQTKKNAERQVKEKEKELANAEMRSAAAEKRAADAETRAADAETRAAAAETRAAAAETMAAAAEEKFEMELRKHTDDEKKARDESVCRLQRKCFKTEALLQEECDNLSDDVTHSWLKEKVLYVSTECKTLQGQHRQLQHSHYARFAELQDLHRQLQSQSIGKEGEIERLTTEFKNLKSQLPHLQSSLNDCFTQLASLQAPEHRLHLQYIGKDGEIESLITEFNNLQSQLPGLESSLDDRLADLVELQALKHQLHLQSIGKDAEIERLSTEVSELHKLVAQKDLEIVNLTGTASEKEARLSETEPELACSQAMCTRLSQEKELN